MYNDFNDYYMTNYKYNIFSVNSKPIIKLDNLIRLNATPTLYKVTYISSNKYDRLIFGNNKNIHQNIPKNWGPFEQIWLQDTNKNSVIETFSIANMKGYLLIDDNTIQEYFIH